MSVQNPILSLGFPGHTGSSEPTKEEKQTLIDLATVKMSEKMAVLPDWKASGALTNAEKALVRTVLLWVAKGEL